MWSKRSEKIIDNAELQYDENAEQWVARYTALDVPISSVDKSREEALADLTDAVASFLD